MKSEYAKLIKAMDTWYKEIDVPVIQIVHSISDDGEVKIAGYKDFPKFRQLLVDEIKDARRYYDRPDERGPITVSIVYVGSDEPLHIYMNGEFWCNLDGDVVS